MAEKTLENINRTAQDLFQKALAALERNNLNYAITMFLQCLAIEPNFTKARQFLRAAQTKRADSAGGFKKMVAAAKSMPLLTRAKIAVNKSPAEAMDLAEQVLNEDPQQSQALSILAEAAEVAGFLETAAQTMEYYAKVHPKDGKAIRWLARCYIKLEQYDQARDAYERALQLNPADFEAQKGLKDATAHEAMQGGGWSEASSYRDVMKDKDQAVALEQESRVVRADDMVSNLIQESLAKLKQDPNNPVIRRELGKLYGQKGDFDTALEYLEALFKAEAGSDPAMEREIAEIKTRRLDDGIVRKKKERATNPANAAALENEITKLETERAELLLMRTERMVERYPNDLMYRYELGALYMKLGRTQDAIAQFQKSVGQPQRRVASLNYLGQCWQQEGLYDMAVDQYLKAIEELPAMDNLKKDLIYNLGTAYERMGDADKAVAEFKKIASVDFNYRDVRQKIMRKPSPNPEAGAA